LVHHTLPPRGRTCAIAHGVPATSFSYPATIACGISPYRYHRFLPPAPLASLPAYLDMNHHRLYFTRFSHSAILPPLNTYWTWRRWRFNLLLPICPGRCWFVAGCCRHITSRLAVDQRRCLVSYRPRPPPPRPMPLTIGSTPLRHFTWTLLPR